MFNPTRWIATLALLCAAVGAGAQQRDVPQPTPPQRIDPAQEAAIIDMVTGVLRGVVPNLPKDPAQFESRLREFLESPAPAIMLNQFLAEALKDVPPETREPLAQWLRDLLETARTQLLYGYTPRRT